MNDTQTMTIWRVLADFGASLESEPELINRTWTIYYRTGGGLPGGGLRNAFVHHEDLSRIEDVLRAQLA
jgi:hypothetical protein